MPDEAGASYPHLYLLPQPVPLPDDLPPPTILQLGLRQQRFLISRTGDTTAVASVKLIINNHREVKIELPPPEMTGDLSAEELFGVAQTLTGLALDKEGMNALACDCLVPDCPELLQILTANGFQINYPDGQPHVTATVWQQNWLIDEEPVSS